VSLTFGEIKTQIANRILDPYFGNANEAWVESEINAAVRRLAKKHDLCQATVTFSLADNNDSGVITSNTTSTTFTISYYNMAGWPTYIIGQGVKLLGFARWIRSYDGTRAKLLPAGDVEIDNLGLLDGEYDVPSHFRTINANDLRLQFYPKLSAASYPHEFEIAFSWLPSKMTVAAHVLPFPEAYQDIVVPEVCMILENALGRPERMQGIALEKSEGMNEIKQAASRNSSVTGDKVQKSYRFVS
jgi:hypothetical protein